MDSLFDVLNRPWPCAFHMARAQGQVAVLRCTDRKVDFARKVHEEMVKRDIRSVLNLDNEKLGAKIRKARLMRTPAMAVIGDKEVEDGGVALRTRAEGELGFKSLDAFRDWMVIATGRPLV